jgi:hypothetical protein
MKTGIARKRYEPWNKGKIVGQNAPLKLKDVLAIRVRLRIQHRLEQRELFDLGIDRKLPACDLVKLRVRDVCHGDRATTRATVLQQKTQRPLQFEITAGTREALEKWIAYAAPTADAYLFPNRTNATQHISTRQHARTVAK